MQEGNWGGGGALVAVTSEVVTVKGLGWPPVGLAARDSSKEREFSYANIKNE